MKKKVLSTLAVILMISSTVSFAAVKEGNFSVTPMVGGFVYDGDQHLDSRIMLGVRAGYNITKALGVEALYDYVTPSDSKSWSLNDVSLHRFGGQALYNFFPDDVLVPYVAAGYSLISFSGSRVNSDIHGAFDYGVGAKYFLTDDIAVRGDLRHIFYGYNSNTFSNFEFALGAYFQFDSPAPAPKPVPPADTDGDGVIDSVDKCPGTPPGVNIDSNGCPIDTDKDGIADYLDKCTGTPPGVAVESNGCPADTDKDGVADYLDKCPGTPSGVVVDSSGCPVDTDKDGVADYLDKCAGTPAGVAVDSKGCPIDSDNDGVPDYRDKCPGTPPGVVVDSNGCPIDTDKDGIADYLDKCPGTPPGIVVDTTGCPIDTDKDGVVDYLDKCPDTPVGTAVDATGCPVETAKLYCDKPAIIAISFDPGKTNIKARHHAELDKLGKFMKEFPNSKGTIGGFTDADGSKEINEKLSQERTDSVRLYIINKFGIDGSRISAKGYGSTKPIASNRTDSGKAKNRRIEASFSCE